VSVVDPRTGLETDALKLASEHRSDEARDVFVPYRTQLSNGYRFDKPFAQPAERRVF
jgi:hypothetical protein